MMFGLGIGYLNGWAMAAADGAKKQIAEWPPHPDRVFMALSAAWFETGMDPSEKEALQYLERLPPPRIAASEATRRRQTKNREPVTSFVPVNDVVRGQKLPAANDLSKLKSAGLAVLPEYRPRQPRKFPAAIPENPVVHLLWETNISRGLQEPMARLCRKVIAIGHSASFVQMWVTTEPPPPTLVPTEGVALHRLRVPGPGRLDYLAARCNRDAAIKYRDALSAAETLRKQRQDIDKNRKAAIKGLKGDDKKAANAPYQQELKMIDQSLADQQAILDEFDGRPPNSLRPEPGLWQGYRRPIEEAEEDIRKSVFDDNIVVLTLSGKRLYPPTTLKLTEAVRGALLSACPEPIPEWISGHRPNRTPSLDPHLAFLPLPFVDADHADGRIMGVALALPRSVEPGEAGAILEPWLRDETTGLPRTISLFDGKWLECRMELETRETPPWNLRADTWTRASRTWATVAPAVLDRHFSGKNKWEKASETMKDACERIGLPRPETLLLHPVSLVRGAPHAREFPPLRRKTDNGRMYHCHAVIRFSEPVTGPVVIGAGRFRGYGLCRPMDGKEASHA